MDTLHSEFLPNYHKVPRELKSEQRDDIHSGAPAAGAAYNLLRGTEELEANAVARWLMDGERLKFC